MNNTRNITVERLTHLEEHVHQNDLESSRTLITVPETMETFRELHSKDLALEIRFQEVGSVIEISDREVHANTLRERVAELTNMHQSFRSEYQTRMIFHENAISKTCNGTAQHPTTLPCAFFVNTWSLEQFLQV